MVSYGGDDVATTYNNLFLDTRARLRKAGVEAAQLEARELVCYAADKSREQLYRAVLEGVAYGTLDVLNTFSAHGHPVERVHVSGGFTRSAVFMQIYADVCGIPFLVTSDYSVALGSAILTAYALGWYPSIPTAADSMVHHQTTVYPDEQNHRLYLREFQRYQRLYRALKNEQIF